MARTNMDGAQRTGMEMQGTVPSVCADWGALLPDAAEDQLNETESHALELHLAGCPACTAQLAAERRGAAWLTLLRADLPSPPAGMVDGILARTSGAGLLAAGAAQEGLPASLAGGSPIAAALAATPHFAPQPVYTRWASNAGSAEGGWRQSIARWLGVEEGFFPARQPRLTMTAAMAFLSVCLTLNLLGASVSHLHAEEFRTGEWGHTVQSKGTNLLRSVEGTRVVYQMESKVNGWLLAENTHGTGLDEMHDDTQLRQ